MKKAEGKEGTYRELEGLLGGGSEALVGLRCVGVRRVVGALIRGPGVAVHLIFLFDGLKVDLLV